VAPHTLLIPFGPLPHLTVSLPEAAVHPLTSSPSPRLPCLLRPPSYILLSSPVLPTLASPMAPLRFQYTSSLMVNYPLHNPTSPPPHPPLTPKYFNHPTHTPPTHPRSTTAPSKDAHSAPPQILHLHYGSMLYCSPQPRVAAQAWLRFIFLVTQSFVFSSETPKPVFRAGLGPPLFRFDAFPSIPNHPLRPCSDFLWPLNIFS